MINLPDRVNVAANNIDYRYSKADGSPWNSVEEWLAMMNDELIEPITYTTILVKQSDYSVKEMWNPTNPTTFVIKNPTSTTNNNNNTSSGECAVYLIKASEWGLTKGDMEKNSEGHYTTTQYEQMRNNGKGISNAVTYAQNNGYTIVILEKGTYCFCTRHCATTLPDIVLYDLNNIELNLNNSLLKLLVDSSENNPYESHTNPYEKSGMILNLSYCRNTTVYNGIFIGDRLLRSYDDLQETRNESTYGITIGGGCRNITIKNCETREFMGDGIGCLGYGWFKGFPENDIVGGTATHRNIKYLIGASYGPQHDWFKASKNITFINNLDTPTNSGKYFDTALTNGFIDLNVLYVDDLDCKNKQADANDRVFSLGNNLGYTRMTECYPYAVDIITYASNEEGALPIRMFTSSYCQRICLGPLERYIKFQYKYEDLLADDYDSSKIYSYGSMVSRSEENAVGFYKCTGTTSGEWDSTKWEFKYIDNVVGTENYSTTTKYFPGATVKKKIGSSYRVGYTCAGNNITGEFDSARWKIIKKNREFVTEVDHYQLTPTECQTYGVHIEGCKIINNHRGGISNLPHETTIENCYFEKNYHRNNDGAAYVNVGGGTAWSTDYFIDQEDVYSSQVTIRNCNFNCNSRNTGKILLGCLRGEVSNCTGCGRFTFYSGSSLTITNNDFEEFTYDYMPSNWYGTAEPARHLQRDVVISNNKFHRSNATPISNQNNQIIMSENFIYEMGGNGGNHNTFYPSANFIFTNNFVKGLGMINRGDVLCYNAFKLDGNKMDIGNGKYRFTSPCLGNGTEIKAGGVLFSGSDTSTDYSGLTIISDDVIGLCSSVNNDEKMIHYFTDCDLSASMGGNGFFFGFSSESRDEGGIIELHFKRCKFRTTSGNSFISPVQSHANLPGSTNAIVPDQIKLFFDECEFYCTTSNLGVDNQYRTITAVATKCTFNHNYVINGNVLENVSDSVDIDTTIPTSAADSHVPSTKLLKTVKEELEQSISGKAASTHTHAQADVTGLETALSSINSSLSGKASSSHTHAQSDITGLETALSGKANTNHTHTIGISDVTNLSTTLAGKSDSSHTHSDLYGSKSVEVTVDPNTLYENGIYGFRGNMDNINANFPADAVSGETNSQNLLMIVCRHFSGIYIYQTLYTKNGIWYRSGAKTGETPFYNMWTKQSTGNRFISSPTEDPNNYTAAGVYFYESTYITLDAENPKTMHANYPEGAFRYNDLAGSMGSTLTVEVNPGGLRIRQILRTPYGRWSRYSAKTATASPWTWNSWLIDNNNLDEEYITADDLVDNIKTVNGNSIVGQGDISIVASAPDMSDYLTREQIENSFVRASDLATINGYSLTDNSNIVTPTAVPSDDAGLSTAIYPIYRVHLFNAVGTPQVALKYSILDFNFESGKTYRMDCDFGVEGITPTYTGFSITLQHADGSEGSQQVHGNFGFKVHKTFTADDNYDKMYIYFESDCDCDFTISYEDTIANLVSGQISEDAMTNKNVVSLVNNLANLKRQFNTKYKFACMGDSITSDQVSGIGSLVGQYLGCELVGNLACGSATLTNGDNYVQSVAVANNVTTPYNTLANQVIRLLQRTTPLGEQIKWTYTGTDVQYSIPTDVATGLGYTEDVPDIVYIAIGVNDSIDCIGNDEDDVLVQDYASLDKKSFASALRWAVETLRCAYPDVQIFVATPLFTGMSDAIQSYGRPYILKKREAILNACASNSVYCIDSTMKSGYTNQVAQTVIRSGAQGIHPRAKHKCMIAKFIAKEIYNNFAPLISESEIVY